LRIGITGSQDWSDEEAVRAMLSLALTSVYRWLHGPSDHYPVTIVHGGCERGADEIAHRLCGQGFGEEVWEVKEEDWARLGRAAGPVRNRNMMRSAHLDLLLAFANRCARDRCRRRVPHWSHGTVNAIEEAAAVGIMTWITYGTLYGPVDN
jgi:hypothetical protein